MPTLLLYVATLAFAGGIAAYSVASFGLVPISLLAIVVVGLSILLWRHGYDAGLVLIVVGGAFLALGMLRMEWGWSNIGVSPLVPVLEETVVLEGVVVREPEVREQSLHLYVRTGPDTVLVIADRYADITYGDQVVATGTLKRPEAFVTETGRTFNYPGYLLARGVEYQLFYPELTVAAESKGQLVLGVLFAVKQRFLEALGEYLPEPARGLAAGLLLGVRASLGEELEDDFRTAGITHIVVLSGFNVTIVVVSITTVLAFFLSMRWRVVAGIVCIAAFALMVGLTATVLRASIMAALALIAQVLGRRKDALRLLFVAGALMLCVNPFLLLYDVGFQLSFLATLGLLLLPPLIATKVPEVGVRWGLREIFIATIATQLAVLPLLMWQIGEVSLVSLVVNMLVLPIVPFAMLGAFLLGVAAIVFPLAASLLAYPTYALLAYIITMATWWAKVPYAAVTVPEIPAWSVIAVYVLCGYGVYHYSYRQREATTDGEQLVGWTIEEEDVVRKTNDGAASRSDAAPSLPVFFR